MPDAPGVTLDCRGSPRRRSAFGRIRPLHSSSSPPRGAYPCPTAAQAALSPMQREVFMNRALSFTVVFLGIALVSSDLCSAQDGAVSTGAPRDQEPVVFTTRQDHQNMLDQLGITKLRPGRDSNPNSPNPANYDQAKANPHPKLPLILETKDRKKVTNPEQWWNERRPEIVELLEREVYGRIPVNVPKVRWEVRETREVQAGGKPAVQRHIVGVVDSSSCPQIEVKISMSLTLPKQTKGPVPVLMSFGWTPFEPSPFGSSVGPGGGPRPPSKEDIAHHRRLGLRDVLNSSTVQDDSGGWQPRQASSAPGADPNAKPTGAGSDSRGHRIDQPRPTAQASTSGGAAGSGLGGRRGAARLTSKRCPKRGREASRHCRRFGATARGALVAMAFDQRFAMGLIASSGKGGNALYRRDFGESLENLATTGGYHWMAGNYMKYSAEESSFGRRTADDLPVDSHMTLALCAPRLTFISHGIPERGDAHWLDHQGSFMAAIAAGPGFRLLGARDLSRSDDYLNEKMPGVNVDMLDGQVLAQAPARRWPHRRPQRRTLHPVGDGAVAGRQEAGRSREAGWPFAEGSRGRPLQDRRRGRPTGVGAAGRRGVDPAALPDHHARELYEAAEHPPGRKQVELRGSRSLRGVRPRQQAGGRGSRSRVGQRRPH